MEINQVYAFLVGEAFMRAEQPRRVAATVLSRPGSKPRCGRRSGMTACPRDADRRRA